MRRPSLRGLALLSESIEVVERLRDRGLLDSENLSLEGSHHNDKVDEAKRNLRKDFYQTRDKPKPVPRTNKQTAYSDKDSQIHSSRDFWEDIEPRVNFNLANLDISGTGFQPDYLKEAEKNPDLP